MEHNKLDPNLTPREVLDALDEWFAHRPTGQSRKNVWDILSALRGPDDKREFEKKATFTNPIRTHAFPKLREALQDDPLMFPSTFAPDGEPLPPIDSLDIWDHFENHARRAIRALKSFPKTS